MKDKKKKKGEAPPPAGLPLLPVSSPLFSSPPLYLLSLFCTAPDRHDPHHLNNYYH
jgi:hypothetical protein